MARLMSATEKLPQKSEKADRIEGLKKDNEINRSRKDTHLPNFDNAEKPRRLIIGGNQ